MWNGKKSAEFKKKYICKNMNETLFYECMTIVFIFNIKHTLNET